MIAVAAHVGDHPPRQRVDDRAAHAVQATGNLVSAVAELATRMQHGEHQGQAGDSLGGVDGHRDAAAVVGHPAPTAVQQFDGDVIAVAGQGFVHRVVDDLVDQMMQAAFAGRSDVHSGTHPDGLETFQHLDLGGAVGTFDLQILGAIGDLDLRAEFDVFGLRTIRQITHRQKLLRSSRNRHQLRWATAHRPTWRTRPNQEILPSARWRSHQMGTPLPQKWACRARQGIVDASSTPRGGPISGQGLPKGPQRIHSSPPPP